MQRDLMLVSQGRVEIVHIIDLMLSAAKWLSMD